jgi:hypothetical protein
MGGSDSGTAFTSEGVKDENEKIAVSRVGDSSMTPSANDDLLKVESLQNLMVSRAEGGQGDPPTYKALRAELIANASLKALLPSFVQTCRDQHQFWTYIKGKFGTYQERRQFIWESFASVVSFLETDAPAPSDYHTMRTLAAFDADEISSLWTKALERRSSDPEGAITSARSLIETVSKHIIDDAGGTYGASDDLPKLFHAASEHLQLAPSQHTEQVFKQILGGCQTVVNGLGALRNKLGDAHGQGRKSVKPSARHAELAVNLAGTMATFLIATWNARIEAKGAPDARNAQKG